MNTVGNVLWFIFTGFLSALGWAILGLALACTIVLLPFALQCLKIAQFTMWPFGRQAIPSSASPAGSAIGNLIWFIPGLFLALFYVVSGVALCFTVIGIPFGAQAFKFVPLAIAPFGKQIVNVKTVTVQMTPI